MKFIAHRGFSRRYAENSLPAFQAVINHPCNGRSLIGIELDIHLTSDGRIPVMHDTTIEGDDGGTVPVALCSFDALQEQFSRKHGITTPPVPDIEEVLDLVDHRTELCFEIKLGPYDFDRFAHRFAAALDVYRPDGDVVVSSFSYELLEQVRPYLDRFDLRYGYIFNNIVALERVPSNVRNRFDLLHPHYALVLGSPESFPHEGKPSRCWTVNEVSKIQKLIDCSSILPIEAIMTDDIDLAARFP